MENKYTPDQSKAFSFGFCAVVAFCFMFFLMAFSKHNYKHIDENFYYLNASFGRTDGLLVGDKVRMAGLDVGRVTSATLDDNFNAILKMEIKEVGTKNTKFAPCATCWSFPINKDKHKIKIVPPPIPIPDTIPDIAPIKTFCIYVLSIN